jgi:hypothetical protein
MRLVSSLGHNPESAFRMIPKSRDDDIALVEIICLREWQEREELKECEPLSRPKGDGLWPDRLSGGRETETVRPSRIFGRILSEYSVEFKATMIDFH